MNNTVHRRTGSDILGIHKVRERCGSITQSRPFLVLCTDRSASKSLGHPFFPPQCFTKLYILLETFRIPQCGGIDGANRSAIDHFSDRY